MQPDRRQVTLGSVVSRLRASPRRQWWTTFALVSILSGLWSLASPLFSGPDEPAHIVHAAAIARGEWTGDEPQDDDAPQAALEVTVPEFFATDPGCFAFRRGVPASCLIFGNDHDADVLTTAGRHPPAYYALIGVTSRGLPPGGLSVRLMRLAGVLLTGAFVASAVRALRRTAEPRLAACGLLVATTPMVLFVSGVVNPSGPEIAAAIALWASGAVLVSKAPEGVDGTLVTCAGAAASVLVLSRQLGPLFLVLIGLCLLATGTAKDIRRLLRAVRVRVWAAVVAACLVAQLAWVIAVNSLDATLNQGEGLDVPASMIRRLAIGEVYGHYRQMLGVFGWQDTTAPALTWLLLTVVLGALVLLAVAFGSRRLVVVMLGVIALTILVPIVLEAQGADDAGLFWSGRYTLPLAVGVPVLAGLALAGSEQRRILGGSWLIPAVGGSVAIAHILAFAQALRRYTVGYHGELQYWKEPHWLDTWSVSLLSVAFVAAMVAFVVWLLHPGSGIRESDRWSG
jgi:hypothetical protein